MSTPVAILQTRIAQNQYDVQAWDLLIDELWAEVQGVPAHLLRQPGLLDRLIEALHSVVSLFPTAARQWKMLADLEMDRGNLEGAKAIFSKCLLSCYNVDLWTSYMRYIKQSNASKGDNGQLEVMTAFEFSLDKVGQDSASGAMWFDFLQFLSAIRPGTSTFARLLNPVPGQEASKRALRLRELYHRALQVPSDHLDKLWGEYERFERGAGGTQSRANPAAGRFIDEMRPRFQAARTAWTKRKSYLDRLHPTALPAVPGKSPGGPSFMDQRRLWLSFLEFEMSNTQGLDARTHRLRVNLSYHQALYPLRNCPEVWYQWTQAWPEDAHEGHVHALATLKEARKALPHCVMLSFAHADLEEQTSQVQRAREIYEELAKRMESGGEASPAGDLPPESGSSVWMQYMHFAMRNGADAATGQMDARRVFVKARKWPHCTWHVFACHALMEWRQLRLQQQQHAQNVLIVKRIFELGLRRDTVRSAPGYIVAFADWLMSTSGDIENARALYENALADEAGLANPDMWDAFLRFEHQYGTLRDVLTVEARRAGILAERRVPVPAWDSFRIMQQRYMPFGLWACTPDQKRHLESYMSDRDPATAGGPAGAPGDAGDGDLPASIAIFISKLPKQLETEQPVPDTDFVIDLILNANLDSPPSAPDNKGGVGGSASGTKRDHQSTQQSPLYTDVYRMRQKQRIEGS